MLEGLIHNQVYTYLPNHKILSPRQLTGYADDTAMWVSASGPQTPKLKLEQHLEDITNWYNKNKFFINITKTKFMVFV